MKTEHHVESNGFSLCRAVCSLPALPAFLTLVIISPLLFCLSGRTIAQERARPPRVTFQPAITLTNGPTFPSSIVAGDFNNDRIPDLGVVGITTGGIGVALGLGNGMFAPWVGTGFGAFSNFVASGDFNRDGNLDVAVTCPTYGMVDVEFGDGKGSFRGGTSISAGKSVTPAKIVVADFNGDGNPDIAFSDGLRHVWVFLGNGDGTFGPGVGYHAGGDGAAWLAVGDFNGDQKLDLVVSDTGNGHQTHATIAVLLGNGDGTFQGAHRFPLPVSGVVAVGDFNHDGKLDVAVAIPDLTSNTKHELVRVLFGEGDGTLRLGPLLDSGPNPEWVAVADFNGDGNLDVAVSNSPCATGCGQAPGSVTVVAGNGDGTFQRGARFPVDLIPGQLVVSDFNGDHKPDIAVITFTHSTESVLLNSTPFPGTHTNP
jgi:hypothetical protein